ASALKHTLVDAVAAGTLRPGPYRAALAQLLAMRDRTTHRRIESAAKGENPTQRLEAAEGPARAGQSRGRDPRFPIASSASGACRLEPGALLAEVGDARARELLLPLLGDATARVRQRALAGLGQLAESGLYNGNAAALSPLLNDADSQVALTAAVATVSILAP